MLTSSSKTQLASEYCHHIWKPTWHSQPSTTWVLWLHANSSTRLEESIRDVAGRVGISRRNDPDADIFQLFHAWLSDPSRRWVLVLDNADDPKVLFDAPKSNEDEVDRNNYRGAQRPIDYLSVPSHGQVIITTRYKQVASTFVDNGDTGVIINVGILKESQAMTLLQKKIDQPIEDDLKHLAAELGYVPLALAQASAYIQHKPCSVKDYLYILKTSDSSKIKLLSSHASSEHTRADLILSTWQITFEHIRQIRPTAADRLSVMSFFDHRSIPDCLLAITLQGDLTDSSAGGTCSSTDDKDDSCTSETPHAEDAEDAEYAEHHPHPDTDLEADMRTLRDFNLASLKPEGKEYEMHPLVPFAVQKWLDSQNQATLWHEQSVKNICAALPASGEFEHWSQWQTLYPHVQLAIKSEPQSREGKLTKASILHQAGRYLYWRELPTASEPLLRDCVQIRRDLLGETHINTMDSEYYLTVSLESSSKVEPAKELLESLWHKRERVLGEGDIDTLTSLLRLADILNDQQKYSIAEQHGRRALTQCKKSLRAGHLFTLDISRVLARSLWQQQKFEEADKLTRCVLDKIQKRSGKATAELLRCANDFGLDLSERGKHEESIFIGRWALEEQGRMRGVEHPRTLATMANLAVSHWEYGESHKAEKLMRQALESCEKILGKDHRLTLVAMENLAGICRDLGLREEALRLIRECVQISRVALGTNDSATIRRTEQMEEWEREEQNASVEDVTERFEDRGDSKRRRNIDSRYERRTKVDGQRVEGSRQQGRPRRSGRRKTTRDKRGRSPSECVVQ